MVKISLNTLPYNRKKKNFLFVLITLSISAFIVINQFQYQQVNAHSHLASPIEMFSLWNDTAPSINGIIGFTPFSLEGEWSSAAVYDLFDYTGDPNGKIIIQNDDSYSYVALDGISFTTEDPGGVWGASIGIDAKNDGILDSDDYSIGFVKNSTGSFVELRQAVNGIWRIIEYGTPGTPLSGSGILVSTGFAKSAFNNVSNHRQYEFRIPYATTPVSPGDILGVGFELFNSEIVMSQYHVWPYVSTNPKLIRVSSKYWGDLHLGEENTYSKYVIEENLNFGPSRMGYNNGTFMTTGDINGDGDQELIVWSNRTVATSKNLISIYDYQSGELISIWNSWESYHYSSMTFTIREIATYDFDEDGLDELYLSGDHFEIYQLQDWRSGLGDFDNWDMVFENYYLSTEWDIDSMTIGSAHHWIGKEELIFTDRYNGYGTYNVLEYDSHNDDTKDAFLLARSHYLPDIYGESVIAVLDVQVADLDDDNWDEILFLSQFASNKTTGLQIREVDDTLDEEYDNPTDHPTYGYEDYLPEDSHSNTFDVSGHTIVVADVDNDGYNETIIVGRDYLRVFSPFEFNATTIPLELRINDGSSSPNMGGGAGVLDIDDDGMNELIVGCADGTVIIYEIENTLSDPDFDSFSVTEEWRGDLGTSPGKGNAIIGLDIDEDGIEEAIIGDNFGQILVLGMGNEPVITITSPYDGSPSSSDTILLEWEVNNDSLPIHHYDITINDTLITRTAGGSQNSFWIPLGFGTNYINISCTDISGDSDWDRITVYHDPGLPEVIITSPSDYHTTDSQTIHVTYTGWDPLGDDLTYYIYVNGTEQIPSTTELFYDVTLPSEGLWNITVVGREIYQRVPRLGLLRVGKANLEEVALFLEEPAK